MRYLIIGWLIGSLFINACVLKGLRAPNLEIEEIKIEEVVHHEKK